MSVSFRRGAATAALLLFAFAGSAAAQGKGRGLGRHRPEEAPAPAPDQPPLAGTGARQFGVWLDDASLPAPGKGWMTFGMGYWRSTQGRQWDAPSFDGGMGLTPRVQMGVSAPLSRVEYGDGSSLSSLGDAFISAKVGLIDPDAKGRKYGVAVTPLLEVLNPNSVPPGEKRVHWALPVSAERRFQGFRTYGSVGYFSRGSAFAAGAVEVPLNAKITVTGALSGARSLKSDPLADALQISRTRWDLTGSAVYFFRPKATLYGSLGRTISGLDENGSSLAVTAGVSLGFQRPPPRP